jgi:uroporphyrinogen III methyltransferase/synthase
MPERSGRVTLVGAGPGDPGLITLHGVEALRQADAVVYDYLASPELLAHAPEQAELIYVGKQAGRHTLAQSEINALLVRLAREGKRVVRLKGGDPFVFGRGGEEAEALVAAGVPFDVVPGVTSAIAAPAYAGIPVTHRGVASSLAIVTGHEDPQKATSAIDWGSLAGIDTLVFLMGVANLPAIAAELIAHGRRSDTPAAVIQWGTVGRQRTVTGTLADIATRVEEAGLGSPAVTVVGAVVGLRERLRWFDRRPLLGLRVLVTRTREQAGRLAEGLRALGAEPVECAVIETAPPLDWAPLDRAIGELGAYRWIAFTSANGVEAFFARLALAGRDARALAGARLAAIGPATAAALAARGLRADVVPAEFVAEALADALGDVRGARVLLARADIARPALAERLRAAGALVDEVVAYRTVRPEGLEARLRQALAGADVVTFTSSSTVRNLFEALGPSEAAQALRGVAVACIGPVTAQTARELGLEPAVVAEEYTIEGLLEALVRWRIEKGNWGN